MVGRRKEDFWGNSADSKDAKVDRLLRRRCQKGSLKALISRGKAALQSKRFYGPDFYRSAPTGEAAEWGEVSVAD